ncbi:MAG: apolipoprotein N-acyltransferase, partial [Campylobacterota bacterium]|nr:apolipoprotein N-acyltransferase [Campylobacterota bacterium]
PISYLKKLSRRKSNTKFLIDCLFASLVFSLFVYLEYFGIENRAIVSLASFYAFYRILTYQKKELFAFGFFTGILWFYWIGLSFRFVDMAYAVPFVILGVALIIALMFFILGFVKYFYLRALVLVFYFDFVQPFGFEWLKPELLLQSSFFNSDKISYFLFLLSVVIFIFFQKNNYKFLFFIPLIFAFNLSPSQQAAEDENIALVSTEYNQDFKWRKDNRKEITNDVLMHIERAIQDGKKLVILPETALPYFLNKQTNLVGVLLEKSNKIDIILGSLYTDGSKQFNSTYFFSKSKMQVAHKSVLVPFGESTNFLPESIGRFINKIFFDGADDYTKGAKPTDFNIDGVLYRNAICYEATVEKMFIDAPKKMIAITNNAWYHPSIEPALQRLVIRFFARKYGVTVYHSVNKSKGGIIS